MLALQSLQEQSGCRVKGFSQFYSSKNYFLEVFDIKKLFVVQYAWSIVFGKINKARVRP